MVEKMMRVLRKCPPNEDILVQLLTQLYLFQKKKSDKNWLKT